MTESERAYLERVAKTLDAFFRSMPTDQLRRLRKALEQDRATGDLTFINGRLDAIAAILRERGSS